MTVKTPYHMGQNPERRPLSPRDPGRIGYMPGIPIPDKQLMLVVDESKVIKTGPNKDVDVYVASCYEHPEGKNSGEAGFLGHGTMMVTGDLVDRVRQAVSQDPSCVSHIRNADGSRKTIYSINADAVSRRSGKDARSMTESMSPVVGPGHAPITAGLAVDPSMLKRAIAHDKQFSAERKEFMAQKNMSRGASQMSSGRPEREASDVEMSM